MKLKELLKEINGVFVPPVKRYYFGKLQFGCPYFYPINYLSTVIRVRKLIPRTEESRKEYMNRYPYHKNKLEAIFSNVPMVQRNKHWLIKNYYIEVGYPIMFKRTELSYKWKFDSIRYEWSPCVQFLFFGLQFCIWWNAPDNDNDRYYEQILWYIHSGKNILKAEKTWGWCDMNGVSTWNNKYLR